VIAFNKIDLLDSTELEHLLKLAPNFKQYEQILSSYQTSAKTGDHVDRIFYELSEHFISS